MSVEENKKVSRRFFEEVFNQKRPEVIDALASPNHVGHDPFTGETRGTASIKELVTMYITAFPDTHISVDDQVAEGNKVVTRWTARGTHQGEMQGIPPTGKTVTVSGIGIDRFENGTIVESWNILDSLGMLQQMGVVPAGEQVRA